MSQKISLMILGEGPEFNRFVSNMVAKFPSLSIEGTRVAGFGNKIEAILSGTLVSDPEPFIEMVNKPETMNVDGFVCHEFSVLLGDTMYRKK